MYGLLNKAQNQKDEVEKMGEAWVDVQCNQCKILGHKRKHNAPPNLHHISILQLTY